MPSHILFFCLFQTTRNFFLVVTESITILQTYTVAQDQTVVLEVHDCYDVHVCYVYDITLFIEEAHSLEPETLRR
jgi:hypothetical protein